jgi:hypothetical protein
MKNRKWILIFVVLAVLGTLAVGINWAFNVSQLLTPEQLTAARALWERQRPADYDLKIIVTKIPASSDGNARPIVDTHVVKVRAGKVVGYTINGRDPEPILDPQGNRNLTAEREQRENYDMAGLFDAIEDFLEKDQREGRRPFARAHFDKKDGHLISYTRQIQGRYEPNIQVKLTRVKE